MLFLAFRLGSERYVLEASKIVEVLPLVELAPVPHAPRCVAGILNYRSKPVPVVDLCELVLGRPAAPHLSTRIMLLDYQTETGQTCLLGLIAENVTEVLRKDSKDFPESGMRLNHAPYLGPIAMDKDGPLHLVQAQKLLPEPVREALFAYTQQAPKTSGQTRLSTLDAADA